MQDSHFVPNASEDQSGAANFTAERPTATLVYVPANGPPVRKNVHRTTTMIGAHADCSLQLLSSQVSQMHCVITLDGRGFRIWDLRSQTGTFVNGRSVKSSRIKDGDRLRIGPFEFRLETSVQDSGRQGFFIDEYRVLGILGTGGMGWLYVVDDPRTLQQYALKVLMRRADRPGVNQDELRTRFLIESLAGDRLKHPNIVEVLDYQQRPDVEYLLLELFESINLQELVHQEGSIDVGFACEVGRQAALALQQIHDAGLVHRDVKPSNILIGHDGRVKICDFGLVMLGNEPLESELAEKLGNDCLGTADYISPEQSYNSYNVDGRADIYSLGCALYTALANRLPFPLDSGRDKIQAHRHQQPTPIEQHNSRVGPELAELIRRCMHKEPNSRFQNCRELAEQLERFAQPGRVNFDFSQILAQRTQQASVRLSDPRKKHYLQRIPANVASSMQAIESYDHLENDQLVIGTQTKQDRLKQDRPTLLPGDTSAATESRE